MMYEGWLTRVLIDHIPVLIVPNLNDSFGMSSAGPLRYELHSIHSCAGRRVNSGSIDSLTRLVVDAQTCHDLQMAEKKG